MEIEIYSLLVSIGIFFLALFTLLIGVLSVLWNIISRRLSKLEKGQDRFEIELKEIRKNQVSFEMKLDKLLARKP